MWLFIEPNDVLLFRDGKPFVAGEDHRARSVFPPTPFTMQGILRSKVLFDSGVSPHDYAHGAPSAQALIQQIGTASGNYGQLRLHGPFVAKRDGNTLTRYFPLPADVVKVDEDFTLLRPLLDYPFVSNQPIGLRPLWTRTVKPLEGVRGWLAEDEFQKYLSGRTDFSVTPERALIVREPRFGIALHYPARSTQEGMLYQMEFLRTHEGVGLVLQVEGIAAFQADKGFLQVGGEARAACYELLKTPMPPVVFPNPLPRRFKVVLLTPGWFSDGWKPRDDNWGQFFTGAGIRLAAAAVGRPQPIGGAFADDRQRSGNFQKPMRRFVPAGSVYFFESNGVTTYPERPLTETPEGEGDFGQIGFGQIAIASWNYS